MIARRDAARPRVLFLNRSYWPDVEATGQLLTELCEDLARSFDVMVLAGQPNQNPENVKFRKYGHQVQHGVHVRRVWNTRLSKSFLPGRAMNLMTYLAAASLASLGGARPDVVVAETDPPLLCLLGAVLQQWHGAKLVVYLQDIYPDVAVALGKLPDGPLTRQLRRTMFGVYRRADRVVVLSRDMRKLLIDSGVPARRITCIPNWIDTRLVAPRAKKNNFREEHGLNGQFVVMYSGNMGLTQRLDEVIEAARRLRDCRDVVFLLIGDGASRRRLEETVRKQALGNVRFLPYQPKQRLAESLGAADLHLVPLDPRVASCLMPSKLYGILASGRPLVAIAPGDCELAQITRREAVGLVVPPGDPGALSDAIRQSAGQRDRLGRMGTTARQLAETHYDRHIATGRFGRMLARLLPRSCGARRPVSSPVTYRA